MDPCKKAKKRSVSPINPEKLANTIYVHDLLDGITAEDLSNYFSQFGKVLSSDFPHIYTDAKIALVHFEQPESAATVLQHEEHLLKDSRILVRATPLDIAAPSDAKRKPTAHTEICVDDDDRPSTSKQESNVRICDDDDDRRSSLSKPVITLRIFDADDERPNASQQTITTRISHDQACTSQQAIIKHELHDNDDDDEDDVRPSISKNLNIKRELNINRQSSSEQAIRAISPVYRTRITNISLLNDVCLGKIIERLDIESQLCFASTCTRLRNLYKNWCAEFFERFALKNLRGMPRNAIYECFKHFGLHMTHVKGICPTKYIYDIFNAMGLHCNKLEFVDIESTKIKHRMINMLIVCLPNLTQLHLFDCDLDDMAVLILSQLKYLKQFSIENNREIDGRYLHKLSPTIEVLNINNCKLNADHISVCCRKLKNLKALHMEKCLDVNNELFENMVQYCKKLELLAFTPTYGYYEILAKLRKLKSLILDTSEYVIRPELYNALIEFKSNQLESIQFIGKNVVDDVVAEKLSQLSALRTLICPYSRHLGAHGFECFANLTKLEELVLLFCFKISDSCMRRLLTSCHKLKRVHLQQCAFLTENFLYDAIAILRQQQLVDPINYQRTEPVTLLLQGTSISNSIVTDPKYLAALDLINVQFMHELTDEPKYRTNKAGIGNAVYFFDRVLGFEARKVEVEEEEEEAEVGREVRVEEVNEVDEVHEDDNEGEDDLEHDEEADEDDENESEGEEEEDDDDDDDDNEDDDDDEAEANVPFETETTDEDEDDNEAEVDTEVENVQSSTSQQTAITDILMLNDHCLEYIMRLLDLNDQVHFASTSRRLQNVYAVLCKVLYRTFDLVNLKDMKSKQSIYNVFKYAGRHIRKVTGDCSSVYYNDIMNAFSMYCNKLDQLEFEYTKLSKRMIDMTINFMPKLTHLHLRNCNLTDRLVFELCELKHLKSLSVEDNRKVFGRYLHYLPPAIEKLNVNNCKLAKRYIIAFCRRLKNLKELHIEKCESMNNMLYEKMTKYCKNIEVFAFTPAFEHYEILVTLPKLKYLILDTSVFDIRPELYNALVQFKSKQLEAIQFIGKNVVNDVVAVKLAQLSALRTLICPYSNELTELGLICYANLSNLKELVINYCVNINDTGMQRVLTSCHKLSRVHLQLCTLLTEKFIFDAIEDLRQQQFNDVTTFQRKEPVTLLMECTNISQFILKHPKYLAGADLISVKFKHELADEPKYRSNSARENLQDIIDQLFEFQNELFANEEDDERNEEADV